MGADVTPIPDRWYIEGRTIKPGRELGRGSFGVVRKAEWRHTPVAVKILYTDSQAEDRELFEKEVRMMATLHHPHVVQFLGYSRTPSLTLVIEYFPNGSLEDFVLSQRSPPATLARFNFEMALAIEYLHSRSPSIVIHRDIKPANFLLTASFRVKLGDFGIARARKNHDEQLRPPQMTRFASDNDLTSNCGTVRWMAPEVSSTDAKTALYNSKADIFSLAMVYFFVWERLLPAIPGHDRPHLHFAALLEGKRPAFQKTPKDVRDLITAMWVLDPTARPDAPDLLDSLHRIQEALQKHKGPFAFLAAAHH